MDHAAIQALVQAAVTAAVAAGLAAVPPAVPPAPVTFALTPGLVNSAAPWNYSSSEGMKLYLQSTTAISPIFNGDPAGLKICLQAIRSKAEAFG